MTSLIIAMMWVTTIAGMYLFMNACFWVFTQIFGVIDNYLQDRAFNKRGFSRVTSEDGEAWYVGYDDRS